MDPDAIRSVADSPEIEFIEKGSRFFGQVFAIDDADAMRAPLAQIRAQYADASHHCWASRIGPPDHCTERNDDDGEPSGTAGQPILGALQREGIHNALIIVTRYFGGTKLGRGGLVRAYGEAARVALAAAPPRTIWKLTRLAIRCDYNDVGAVEAIVGRLGEQVVAVERDFAETPRILVTVRSSAADAVRQAVTDATAGRAAVGSDPDDSSSGV
ncbi:MAG: YigZ family protein [Planctomycetota bacterium]